MAYVYRHIRLDKNQVFYVGIGSDTTGDYWRAREKCRRTAFWSKIISKTDYIWEIMLDDLTWEEACEKEKEFIKLYGRRDLGLGTLVNLTDGGEGIVGLIKSSEHKRKIGNSNRGKTHILQRSSLVLNMETGIYYDTIAEAAKTLTTNTGYLYRWVHGHRPNRSSFKIV